MANQTYILNFTVSRSLPDIKNYYENNSGTNIDFLLNDFAYGKTEWSVPKNAVPGDIAVFMCAKTARDNLGMATSHLPADCSYEFRAFVDQQKAKYKQYSGHLLGYGVVSSFPEYEANSRRWFSYIDQLRPFGNPISIDEFRDFITVNRTNSITYLNDNQWERLKWLINQKNSMFFPNVVPPDAEILEREFKNKVRKEESKPLDKLKKEAAKKASQPTASTVQTTVYHRDPTIAAYVKKRANGFCQLCGQKAPFEDQHGDPYLECHHVVWISNGGMDSIENCVALCPNCHKKMHILNSGEDLSKLKAKCE